MRFEPEGGGAGTADGVDHPRAAPLRRDSLLKRRCTPRRDTALHGRRRRPLAAGDLAAAARLLPGRGSDCLHRPDFSPLEVIGLHLRGCVSRSN